MTTEVRTRMGGYAAKCPAKLPQLLDDNLPWS